jgi:cathepsin F
LFIAIFLRILIIAFPISQERQASNENHIEDGENYMERVFRKELPELVREFNSFEIRFEKVWSGDVERVERFKNFKRNYYDVKRYNRRAISEGKNTTFGVNAFSDWTEEETKKMLMPLGSHKKYRSGKNSFIQKINPIYENFQAEGDEYPDFFDWRDKGMVTPVKAQGQCGSCWAFAATATVESAFAIATGELRNLSEQELLDCNLSNNGCNGGNENKAFRFIHEHGLVRLDEYPYIAKRHNSCHVKPEEENVKISSAYYLNPDEQSIIDWLVNFGPVNIGSVSVPPDMKPYKSGIYYPSDYDCKFNVLGLHALMIVGYGRSDEGEKYWIVKNSWGADWGDMHGYFYFIRGVNACGIEDNPTGILV